MCFMYWILAAATMLCSQSYPRASAISCAVASTCPGAGGAGDETGMMDRAHIQELHVRVGLRIWD